MTAKVNRSIEGEFSSKAIQLVQALFHHILHEKCTYSQALRLAKLQLIEAGGELRDWAGFALLGI